MTSPLGGTEEGGGGGGGGDPPLESDSEPESVVYSGLKCRKSTDVERLDCKGTLRQMFICLRPPPLLGLLFGVLK